MHICTQSTQKYYNVYSAGHGLRIPNRDAWETGDKCPKWRQKGSYELQSQEEYMHREAQSVIRHVEYLFQ